MKSKLSKPVKILPSMCDNTSKLSIPAIFSLFMDLASEHGTEMGLGADELSKQGLFWLTVRTKVQIFDRPQMIDEALAETWPEEPGRVRTNRYYSVSVNGKLSAVGKTEWAIIETESGRLKKIAEVYPDGMEYCTNKVCDEPFARLSEDFTDCEILDTYKVKSTDIDLGQHMNNAAYIRVLFGAFSCEELEKMNVREADIAFRTPCYEGDVLTVRYRKADGGIELGVINSEGKTAAVARFLTD